MHDGNESELYNYWQAGLQQQALHNLTASQIQKYGRCISRAECESGKLNQKGLISNLKLSGDIMAVLPYNSSCILLCNLESDGTFNSLDYLGLPVFPYNLSDLNIENLENFIVIEPPPWRDSDDAITWPQQLNYAVQVLDNVAEGWRDNIWEHSFIFPINELCPAISMDISLLNQPNKITTIEVSRNSGGSTYAKNIVVDAWIDAAARCAAAPKYVWFEYSKPLRYATIFSCYSVNNTDNTCYGDVHLEFLRIYNIYNTGKQFFNNWRDISNEIESKYEDHGGIYTRLNQLHSNLNELRVQLRHLQVLRSIWIRQLQLLSKASKAFDFIPWLKAMRLQRLHLFFKQNFPNESTVNWDQVKFEQSFEAKLRRVTNSERSVADALHQAESDLHQENLVRDKCWNWCIAQNATVKNIEDIETLLEKTFFPQLAAAAVSYWHEYFIKNPQELQLLNNNPETIDVLIVEHSEYISPMQAAQLLAISKSAIVMGNNSPICVPRFSVQIDYELTKHYQLTDCDADFEDLQFDGKLASLGNMWNLVITDNEPDKVLEYPCQEISYSYIDTKEPGAIQATLKWLQDNQSLSAQTIIYSCFSEHIARLQAVLQDTPFSNVTIRLIQEPYFGKKPISLFLPVYMLEDPGPYVFDRGSEIIDNLIANTMQHLIVIGDMRIFKPELHSASGKLAKHLLIQEEEVDCVGV